MSSNITIDKYCEQCGKLFTAKTTVTRFCSKVCNSRNYKQKLREEKIGVAKESVRQTVTHQLSELTTLEFLSVKDSAKLLGVTDRVIYGMIKSGRLRATNLSARTTRISRADIDGLFELPAIDNQIPNSSNLSECCHMGEAQITYNISEKALFEVIKRNSVPKYQLGKFTYVLKCHLEKIFNPENMRNTELSTTTDR